MRNPSAPPVTREQTRRQHNTRLLTVIGIITGLAVTDAGRIGGWREFVVALVTAVPFVVTGRCLEKHQLPTGRALSFAFAGLIAVIVGILVAMSFPWHFSVDTSNT